MKLFDLVLKGGFLMWPILLCSITSIAIIIDRLLFFSKIKPRMTNLFARVRHYLKQGRPEDALQLCEQTEGPIPHILAIGIRIRNRTLDERERILSQASVKFIRQLDERVNVLAIIANISPLLGLLGTVYGMIRTFMKIQELSGQVEVSLLAGGIWEALITTAAGLSVAIVTTVFYHYFDGKIDFMSNEVKDITSELIEIES